MLVDVQLAFACIWGNVVGKIQRDEGKPATEFAFLAGHLFQDIRAGRVEEEDYNFVSRQHVKLCMNIECHVKPERPSSKLYSMTNVHVATWPKGQEKAEGQHVRLCETA